MVTENQKFLIRKAFTIASEKDENGEIITKLAPLSKSLKKDKISIDIFREWMYERNENPKCKYPKEWLDCTIDAIYFKY